ncbi:NrdH-redoxin, partial [Klebsiella pneumoniae]|nr:NrdH-redoxin [Klebsiella pneumoniae]
MCRNTKEKTERTSFPFFIAIFILEEYNKKQ